MLKSGFAPGVTNSAGRGRTVGFDPLYHPFYPFLIKDIIWLQGLGAELGMGPGSRFVWTTCRVLVRDLQK